MALRQKLCAEFFGTALLLAVVVGSGIMGENLSQGNAAIALLANAIATGAGLYVLIYCLGPISGAHFNPVVSFVKLVSKHLSFRDFALYGLCQFGGAVFGTVLSHAMFDLELIQFSSKTRSGGPLLLSELVATLGLLGVIGLVERRRSDSFAPVVAAYITAAYWFTSSTSFANPAVTLARSLTDTFSGISPDSVFGFLAMQILAGILVGAAYRWAHGTKGRL